MSGLASSLPALPAHPRGLLWCRPGLPLSRRAHGGGTAEAAAAGCRPGSRRRRAGCGGGGALRQPIPAAGRARAGPPGLADLPGREAGAPPRGAAGAGLAAAQALRPSPRQAGDPRGTPSPSSRGSEGNTHRHPLLQGQRLTALGVEQTLAGSPSGRSLAQQTASS